MSALHVTQIRAALARLLDGKIDLSDLPRNLDAARRADSFATRSLAAYGTSLAADVSPEVVSDYVVDSFGDNGIDVIYFDPDERRLYLCQSKFAKNGDAGIPLGDGLKFLAGVRDLLNNDFRRFRNNKRVLALKNLVTQALEDATTRVTLVLVYTSLEPLSVDIKSRIDELIQEVNDASEIINLKVYNQSDIHSALSGHAEGAPLSIEAMISDWGYVKDPIQAYYGQINAAELATLYSKHGDRLLTKNIRKSLGSTDVNRQIISTASASPEHFWYFNNGVTVLCQSVVKKPLGGGGRASAVLECRGISIVNGAQTVAALSEAAEKQPTEVKRASVLIRFISLEGCPEGFATAVTRATNVQNRIEHRDFASLDPTQERLRRELLLEGKAYSYKASGETITTSDSACTMEEAAIALACSHQDVALAVLAKNQIGRVWDNLDAQRSAYKRLFRDTLTGVALWRLVELLRTIDEVLRNQQKTRPDSKERMIAVHGNRFVAHEVFRRLDVESTSSSDCDLVQLRAEVPSITDRILPLVATAVRTEFPNAYLQSLFKNTRKCQRISAILKRDWQKLSVSGAADGTRVPSASIRTKEGGQAQRAMRGSVKKSQKVPRRIEQRASRIFNPAGLALTSELNAKEQTVLAYLRRRRTEVGLAEIGAEAFPGEASARANSWARNSLRKLVRVGLANRVGRGTYTLR